MSISVVSAEELAMLQGMFPNETSDSLRRALREHKGDLDATIEGLLTKPSGAPTEPKDVKPITTNLWTCKACTFENDEGTRRCAMCDGPGPLAGTTAKPTDPVTTEPQGGGGQVVVPPWWDTFWAEHRSSLNCDERAAKEVLFAGGRFKNSQILTVDIKSKIYRLLGAEEVHHIAPPDDNGYDDYNNGFNPFVFPPGPVRRAGPGYPAPHFAPHFARGKG